MYQIRMLLTRLSNIFSPNNIFSGRYQCTKKEKRKDRELDATKQGEPSNMMKPKPKILSHLAPHHRHSTTALTLPPLLPPLHRFCSAAATPLPLRRHHHHRHSTAATPPPPPLRCRSAATKQHHYHDEYRQTSNMWWPHGKAPTR